MCLAPGRRPNSFESQRSLFSARASSGYISDVAHAPKPLAHKLVPHHDKDGGRALHRLYDTSESWELGRGGGGAVTTVKRRSTGEMFAMKTVKLDGMDVTMVDELRREIEIQRSLDHPNIVKIVESFEDQRLVRNGSSLVSEHRLYIVMELCTGGSLVSRLQAKPYSEGVAARLVEKMLRAVYYCHSHGIIHRDLKLDNFVYETQAEDAEIKLIDFGFAFEVQPGDKDEMFERLGTLSYMAPELLGKNKKRAYDSSVDMWAMGALTCVLRRKALPMFTSPQAVRSKVMYKRQPWVCRSSSRGPSGSASRTKPRTSA